jgi:hypothetical protein
MNKPGIEPEPTVPGPKNGRGIFPALKKVVFWHFLEDGLSDSPVFNTINF